MPVLKKTMFREYDIRGKETPDELTDQAMYFLGKGFGTYLKNKQIDNCIVGHDIRASSEKFLESLIKGLTETGINVTNIGSATTPMGYWAQHFLNIKGLAMVTASHNPTGWNGLKICQDLSRNLFGDEIQEIHRIIESEKFNSGAGTVKTQDIKQDYINDLLTKAKFNKKFKILVNTGNGTASMIAPDILRQAGCEVVEHNTNIDPTYPNYTPNPENIKMMEDTSTQTLKNTCDLGMAFDGDGDRLGIVDEKGNIISSDRFEILLARLVLSKHPGAKIMADVKVSEILLEEIKKLGGEPILYRTGHSLIKKKMKEDNISLAAEMSGHIFFSDGYYGFDDATFAALELLVYLSSQDKTLSELMAEIPVYPVTPMITVNASDDVKHKIVQTIVDELKKEGLKVLDVDGARFYTDDGWGLIRASNTNPILVLRFEAKTQDGIERLKQIIKTQLDKYPEVDRNWVEGG